MNKIFAGMLLVFLNFNIDIGSSRIGLIPGFIGYIVMLSGTAELTQLSQRFQKVRPPIVFMAVYSAIFYVLDISGLPGSGSGIISLIAALPSMILSLFISFNIVMGIFDIESLLTRDLRACKLYSVWKLQAVLTVITYPTLVFPGPAFFGMIALFVVAIIYLAAFNGTRKLFYA